MENANRKNVGNRLLRAGKRAGIALLVIAAILTAVFLAGRYGWKLLGFRACQGAKIETVAVSEDKVQITGYCPGFFSKGFCGCYSEERDGTLYVGFRFSSVFGFFETGQFDITVPVKGNISKVVLKTDRNESVLWERETGFVPQLKYGKPEGEDIFFVPMSYDGFGGLDTDSLAWERRRTI